MLQTNSLTAAEAVVVLACTLPDDLWLGNDLLAKADQTIVLRKNYYTRCFLDRDDFLVKNSSMIVAYYDGRNRGGTFYTMNQADRHKVPVVNL